MTREELLTQLKDIRSPEDPAWWLPAPGYLVVGCAVLVLLAILAFWLWRRRAERRLVTARRELRRIAAEHVGENNALGLARALAPWLKRVALQAYPGQRLESVSGTAWLEFLDRSSGGSDFTRGPGRVFGSDIYRLGPASPGDSKALLELCDSWHGVIGPRLRGEGG